MNELKIYTKFSEKEYVMYENKLHKIESIEFDVKNDEGYYIAKLNYKLDDGTMTTEDKLLKLRFISSKVNMSLCESDYVTETTYEDEFGNRHTFLHNF